ncbi:hypothetical protein PDESU_04547 [Pontiella desulfatans]|uniref:Lipoprotein n=1 Tax=Pontiella desulfatans TaxID=2750659 RepID=A0A6C2U798_PONDE|nr:hypothetical protein [Pontiella desulfatans]VGO15958.1 hypothetical protein PDESU_04547 [Pontiella desulfatans]
MKIEWWKLARRGAMAAIIGCFAIGVIGCGDDDGTTESDAVTYYFNWSETDGDEGEGSMTITVEGTTFSGTLEVTKFTNEGGTYTYGISGDLTATGLSGVDARGRSWNVVIDGASISGSYYDPDGGETGTVTLR